MARIDYLRCLLLPATLLAPVACGGPPPPERPSDDTLNVVTPTAAELESGAALPDSYIVAFRSDGASNQLRYPNYIAEYRAHYQILADAYLSDPRIKDIQFLTAIDLQDPGSTPEGDDIGASPLLRLAWKDARGAPLVASVARVDFASDADARSLLGEWETGGDIWFAEPNGVSRLSQDTPDTPPDTPDTPTNEFQRLSEEYTKINYWWLNAINLPFAFESIGARDLNVAGAPTDEDILNNPPIIAVLDSGVDYDHPALKDRIWVNDDVNAADCSNDLHGCNTTTARRGKLGDGDVWPYDTSGPGQACTGRDPNCSHGTHVAGLVAADNNWVDPATGHQVAGICPVCRVMILKIVSKVGKDSGILDSSIIAAFKYVSLFERKDGAAVRVINASFGKFVRSRAVGLLIRLLKEKRGTLVIAAAGNEDTLTMEYPAAFKDAVAVAAVDSRLYKVAFSNFGRWVDISAPGSGIRSTTPGSNAEEKSGTSMATPIVSGVAGLLLARYPGMSFDDLRGTLLHTADPAFYGKDFGGEGFNYYNYYPEIPAAKGRVPLLGYGLLNANAAVNRVPTEGLPIYLDDERVKRGCGVVADARHAPLAALALALSLPLAIALRQSLQVMRAMFRKRRSSPTRFSA